MKYSLFLLFFLTVLFPNCKKEQIIIKTPDPIDTIVPIEHIIDLGKGSVIKNGSNWVATNTATYHYHTKTRFFLVAKNEYSNGLKETFAIQDILLQKGKQLIEYATSIGDLSNSVPNAAYTMSAYDEGIGNFYPDTTRTGNFIEILRVDTMANEVEGRYQVFLGKDSPSTIQGVPDSVFLTEGKFYLKLKSL